MPQPWQLRCTECEGLARELQDAWRSDQQDIRVDFRQTAQSAGRDPETFLLPWVMSLAQMPDSEFDSLQSARYPRVAEVRRKWKEHETLSGHSGVGNGWRGAFIFDVVLRSGYYGFLKGGGLR
jgi:hypothetical protein